MKNHIFLLTYDLKRFERWCANAGLAESKTDSKINIIVDTRGMVAEGLSLTKIYAHVDKFRKVADKYLGKKQWEWEVTNSIEVIAHAINCSCIDQRFSVYTDQLFRILKIYPLALKLLIPVYAHYALSLKKFMILDDDTFYLKPVDEFFKHKFVIKKKHTLKIRNEPVIEIFREVFPDASRKFILQNKHLINSGHLIMTWSKDYENDVARFFASPLVLSALNKIHEKHGKMSRGTYWLLEEYFFGIHIRLRHEKSTKEFANAVRLIKIDPRLNSKFAQEEMRVLPHIIHLLPKDKLGLFDYYEPLVKACLAKTTSTSNE